jgi:hypothetical protein
MHKYIVNNTFNAREKVIIFLNPSRIFTLLSEWEQSYLLKLCALKNSALILFDILVRPAKNMGVCIN